MRKAFLPRLAATGLKNNRQTYLPYFLTFVGTVVMYYNLCALSYHTSTGDGNLSILMGMGRNITLVFSIIFLFYTNSFLIKRRKKEFGLYNILGMEKKHIGVMMLWESLYVYLGGILIGLLTGILFNKAMTLALYRIVNFDPDFSFEISLEGIVRSILLFAGITVINLLYNLLQVRMANPIQLLRGGNAGEKEPKTNWICTILGVLTLGSGYWLVLTTKSPMDAIGVFFIAVLLVIAGTYLLFCAGSIALLKLMRKNKRYYYKPAHFTTVSGMIYRMKQNAAGLASICILSTAVLVMISTTVSLFIGMEDMLATSYPAQISVRVQYDPESGFEQDDLISHLEAEIEEEGRMIENLKAYTSLTAYGVWNGDALVWRSDEGDEPTLSETYLIIMMTTEDYAAMTGEQLPVGKGEAWAFGKMFGQAGSIGRDTLEVLGVPFALAGSSTDLPTLNSYTNWMMEKCCVVVDSDAEILSVANTFISAEGGESDPFYCHISLDTDGTQEERYALAEKLSVIWDKGFPGCTISSFSSIELSRIAFMEIYGGVFFLGIFLGALFLMATVLIIYYKQVVEGYEDRERFSIMQKVGMSRQEVKKTVHSQVLTVFFVPLVAAAIHITVAFPILTKMLSMFNLENVPLFFWCTVATVLVFALIYGIVYAVTARVYYRIVYRKQ